MSKRIECFDIGYADVFVFENYLVSQIKDGVSVGLEHVEDLKKMIDKHYRDEKLVYISNRIGSYSVDPLVYPEVGRIENLMGVAIVTDSPINTKNAQFEKIFYNKEFVIFKTLSEAIVWATATIKNRNLKRATINKPNK